MSTGPSLGPSLASSTDDLRATLTRHAATASGTVPTTTRASLAVDRARRDRSRRRALVGGVLAAAAVAAVAVVGLPGNGSSQVAPAAPPASASTAPAARPPRLTGYTYPATVVVSGVTYRAASSYLEAAGSRLLRVDTVAASPDQVLAWSSSPDTRGEVVVRVDGRVVSRSSAGALESGALVRGGRAHTITVRASRLRGGQSLALATYQR